MGQGQGSEENKLKIFAAKVLPHSFKEENQMLLKRLSAYSMKDNEEEQGIIDM